MDPGPKKHTLSSFLAGTRVLKYVGYLDPLRDSLTLRMEQVGVGTISATLYNPGQNSMATVRASFLNSASGGTCTCGASPH